MKEMEQTAAAQHTTAAAVTPDSAAHHSSDVWGSVEDVTEMEYVGVARTPDSAAHHSSDVWRNTSGQLSSHAQPPEAAQGAEPCGAGSSVMRRGLEKLFDELVSDFASVEQFRAFRRKLLDMSVGVGLGDDFAEWFIGFRDQLDQKCQKPWS